MPDTTKLNEEKRDQYMQIMEQAQKIDDQKLIRLILKKLADLGRAGVTTTNSGCMIIPFPGVDYPPPISPCYERESWWTLFKVALAVPGTLIALFLVAYFRGVPPVGW